MKIRPFARPLLFLACLVALACRSSAPVRYFLLSTESAAVVAAPAEVSAPSIGIGPITLPPYLDRPQIVVRRGGTEVELSEQNRWAEPLDHNFTAALADHVAARTGSDAVLTYPWSSGQPIDRRVRGEVLRFDVDETGQAVLVVRWQLENGEGELIGSVGRTRYTHSASSGDPAASVKALAATVSAFGDDLVAAMGESD